MGLAAADAQFHVLAVDDSLIDRKLIERLLKTSSYQVTTVDSGSKALEFLGLNNEDEIRNEDESCVNCPKNHNQEVEVNLVITDYCMPGMTGYDLLKKMKESSFLRNIPVVIMSSENVPSRINRCLEEGAEEFFLKPVRLSDVNKLRPHIVKKAKSCSLEVEKQPQEVEKQQENDQENSEIVQLQTTTTTTQSNNNNNSSNGKRKSSDEGLSPDRTRQRFSDLIFISN